MANFNVLLTGSATNIPSTTAFTFTIPSGAPGTGVQVGDVMIVSINVFTFSANTFGMSTPSSGGGSWTQIGTTQPGSQGTIEGWGSVWMRVATASDPGSTFTMSWTGTNSGGNQFWWAADGGAYTSFYTPSPIGNFKATVVNSATVTCPSIPTLRAGSWGIYFCPSSVTSSGTITAAPATSRNINNPGAGVDNAISDTNGSAGPVGSTIGGGNFTLSASSGGDGIAFTIELATQPPPITETPPRSKSPVPATARSRLRYGAHNPPTPPAVVTAAVPLPSSLRDYRRAPKIPPRGSADQGWLKGISQPPVPPVSVHDVRRPVKIPPRGTAWRPPVAGLLSPPQLSPAPVRDARRPVRLPPRSGTAFWNGGISQPPIPPAAVHAARRIRLPWRASTGWNRGVSQPPVPPAAVRDIRRVVVLRRSAPSWQQGVSQPPVPPQAVRDTRSPLRFRRPWEGSPPGQTTAPPPVAAFIPSSVRAFRRPARFPQHEAQAQPGGGTSQPVTLAPPSAVRAARRPPRLWRAARAVFTPAPPLPPPGHAGRRPARLPPRGSALAQPGGGVTQPLSVPQVPVPRRRVLTIRRGPAEGWQRGTSQPPLPGQGVTRSAKPRLARRSVITTPAALPPPKAVQEPQSPPRRPWLPKWLRRGKIASAPGAVTTAPTIGGYWWAVPSSPRWKVGPQAKWRIRMPGTFDPIAAISTEQVAVSWTSELAGTTVDPTGQTQGQPQLAVNFSFPVSSGSPTAPAEPNGWLQGEWVLGTTTPEYIAVCLVGPSPGVIQLTAGQKYDVWSQIIGNPETPTKYAGTISVY